MSNDKRKPVVYHGKQYPSMLSACKELGVLQQTISNRMKSKGLTFEEAVDYIGSEPRFIPVLYKGVSYDSVGDACAILNLDFNRVHGEMTMLGLTFEQAVKKLDS